MVNRVIKNCNSALKTDIAPIQSLRYSDEVDTDEELGPLPRTKDNSSAAVTTVTSETLYTAEETPAQTGLQARVETITKKRRGRSVSVSVTGKEPRNLQRGRGRQGARKRGGELVRIPQRATKRKHRY